MSQICQQDNQLALLTLTNSPTRAGLLFVDTVPRAAHHSSHSWYSSVTLLAMSSSSLASKLCFSMSERNLSTVDTRNKCKEEALYALNKQLTFLRSQVITFDGSRRRTNEVSALALRRTFALQFSCAHSRAAGE